MNKRIFALLIALMLFLQSFSQLSEIKGVIKDTTSNTFVKNAVVAVLTAKDSLLVKFQRTNENGSFSLQNIKQGNYILMIMHPLFADYVDNIEVKKAVEDLSFIPVTSKSKLLAAVILKSGSPIKIKGDTTIYTADSFKVSANANVEELLKKLPGIQVDKNGEIKAMGEKVEKVLVDGEEFFGDDPGMAVKNLRADAVKEVQVFDKKSDQAEFTGIDDGKTKKTINLKLKEDKKTGYFGKIDIAGGLIKKIDDRYNSNLLYGSFKGKRKLSAFLLSGNTGQDGLSWQDNQKYGSNDDNMGMGLDDDGGFMYSWRGGTSDDEPNVNTANGFIKNINAGLQYTNKWNSDKQTLNVTPKYNEQDYDNRKQTFRQTQIGDSVLNENADDVTYIRRHNIKIKGTYDVKLDSANSFKLTASTNFYHTESEETRNAVTTGKTGYLKNASNKLTRLNNDKYALSGNIIFKHKFKKVRRTLSVTADWNTLNTDGTNYVKSFNESFDPANPYILNIDQMITSDKSTQKITSKIVYTEPLSKRYSIEFAHEISYSSGKNDQTTYNYSPATDKYDESVDSLSNEFTQSILTNKPSVKLSYANKKVKFNFGSGFGLTHFDFVDKTFNKDYTRNFTNFFPSASFTYTYKNNHNLKISYNGSTTQPTINQLQPLRNNNDQFNQYIGNPELKASFANSFNITNNGYDFIKERWMFQSLNISATGNSITNNIITDVNSGKTTTQPINTNGNISINLWSGVGFKIKKINTRFTITPILSYIRFADVIDGKTSFSKTTNAGLNVYLQKTKDKKYDFSLGNEFSYNNNKTSQAGSGSHYNINTFSLDATVYIHKVWSIGSDYQLFARQKINQSDDNLTTNLWNAKLQRTFKKNEFTAYIKVRDILNQNIGIERKYYSNTYTEERNDRLKRYFLLGFTWDFKNKPAKKK